MLGLMSKIFTLLTISILVFSCHSTNNYKTPTDMPPLILWAWEAPQVLNTINSEKIGIAELIASISIFSDKVEFYKRQQPLYIPPNTYLIAVMHIGKPPIKIKMEDFLANYLADKISRVYLEKSYRQLQIDFDVRVSERDFYRKLLLVLRKKLGSKTIISITALASWCTYDRWIDQYNLPINYVVPMFFSLDQNIKRREHFISHFPKNSKLLANYCQGPLGLAIYEPWQVPFDTKSSIFIYTQGGWRNDALIKAQQLFEQHHLEF